MPIGMFGKTQGGLDPAVLHSPLRSTSTPLSANLDDVAEATRPVVKRFCDLYLFMWRVLLPDGNEGSREHLSYFSG